MRTLLVLIVAALTFQFSTAPASWGDVLTKASPSIVRLEITDDKSEPDGTCSAFSINQTHRYFLSAAHCYGAQMHVGAHMAQPIYFSPELDLMVLSIPGLPRPALRAGRQATTGQDIAAIGFAEGLGLAIRTGAVQRADQLRTVAIGDPLSFVELTARFLETDFAVIGGMSGGPMVDRGGRVIGVNQASNSNRALGRPMSVIVDAVGGYWE